MPSEDWTMMLLLRSLFILFHCRSKHVREYRFSPVLAQYFAGHRVCIHSVLLAWRIFIQSLPFLVTDILPLLLCTNLLIYWCPWVQYHHWWCGTKHQNHWFMCSSWTSKVSLLMANNILASIGILTFSMNLKDVRKQSMELSLPRAFPAFHFYFLYSFFYKNLQSYALSDHDDRYPTKTFVFILFFCHHHFLLYLGHSQSFCLQ